MFRLPQALLHAMMGMGILGLLTKLHTWDDSAMFFDGSSLGALHFLYDLIRLGLMRPLQLRSCSPFPCICPPPCPRSARSSRRLQASILRRTSWRQCRSSLQAMSSSSDSSGWC